MPIDRQSLITFAASVSVAFSSGGPVTAQVESPRVPLTPLPELKGPYVREGDTTNTKPLSLREAGLLKKIRSKSNSPAWRRYGQCEYDWSGWKLHPNGTRTTAADCGGTAMRWIIPVSCNRLLVATQSRVRGQPREWSAWEPPSGPENKFRKGEDEMVAALCANVIP
jgi:hypothetical protein